VIIGDMRSSMVAAKSAAAIGCVFYFGFGRGRFDPVKFWRASA
jgi:hypothetical protein